MDIEFIFEEMNRVLKSGVNNSVSSIINLEEHYQLIHSFIINDIHYSASTVLSKISLCKLNNEQKKRYLNLKLYKTLTEIMKTINKDFQKNLTH